MRIRMELVGLTIFVIQFVEKFLVGAKPNKKKIAQSSVRTIKGGGPFTPGPRLGAPYHPQGQKFFWPNLIRNHSVCGRKGVFYTF